MLEQEAKQLYCPYIKDKCIGSNCMGWAGKVNKRATGKRVLVPDTDVEGKMIEADEFIETSDGYCKVIGKV